RILAAKLVYGAGDGRYRGVCHYRAWANRGCPAEVVEIAAAGEESLVQVAGTTLHELGHGVAAGERGTAWTGSGPSSGSACAGDPDRGRPAGGGPGSTATRPSWRHSVPSGSPRLPS